MVQANVLRKHSAAPRRAPVSASKQKTTRRRLHHALGRADSGGPPANSAPAASSSSSSDPSASAASSCLPPPPPPSQAQHQQRQPYPTTEPPLLDPWEISLLPPPRRECCNGDNVDGDVDGVDDGTTKLVLGHEPALPPASPAPFWLSGAIRRRRRPPAYA